MQRRRGFRVRFHRDTANITESERRIHNHALNCRKFRVEEGTVRNRIIITRQNSIIHFSHQNIANLIIDQRRRKQRQRRANRASRRVRYLHYSLHHHEIFITITPRFAAHLRFHISLQRNARSWTKIRTHSSSHTTNNLSRIQQHNQIAKDHIRRREDYRRRGIESRKKEEQALPVNTTSSPTSHCVKIRYVFSLRIYFRLRISNAFNHESLCA